MDVAVDLRKNSKTFGKYYSLIISDKSDYSFYVPEGFAHGFLCLSDKCIVHYKCSEYRHKESETTLHWSDQTVKIKWPIKKPILSKKDKIGKDLSTEDGYNAAVRCALSIVSQAKKYLGNDISKIKSCIKLTGYVNSTDDFIEQPKVINGASDTIVKIFGDIGIHTRAAVSTNSLPLGVAVEVDAIFEIN